MSTLTNIIVNQASNNKKINDVHKHFKHKAYSDMRLR